MMTRFNVFSLAVVALVLGFTSCSNERGTELQEGGVELGLTTTIQNQSRVTTQADGITNHWDASDAIGVFSTTLSATNVQYTASVAGASTDFVGGSVMIPRGAEIHNVQAYYPYNTDATTTSIAFDLTAKNDQPVLWGQGTVTHAAPTLALSFAHKLGKLRIVVDASGVENATTVGTTAVSVINVLSKGTLDVVSGNFTPATDVATLSLIKKDTEYYTYLMPTQVLTNLVVKVEHGDKVYNAKLTTDKSVEAGKYYRYTIVLKDGATEVVIGGDNPIDSETPGDEGSIDVNPEPNPTTPVDGTITGTGFSEGVLSATAEGGSFTLTLDAVDPATTAVTAKVAETWVSAVTGDNVTLTRATTRDITFVVDKNTETTERTATVTLTAEGMNPYTFTIKQAGATGAEPTPRKLLAPGSDFEDWNAFLAGLNSFGLKYAVSADGGVTGKAMHINGAPTKNDFAFTFTVPEGAPATASSISLYIKGTTSAKSLSFNVYTADGKYKPFNLGTVEKATDIVLEYSAQNGYTGPINTDNQWVKVTLNVSGLQLATTGNYFAVKVGGPDTYDLLIDDITIE